MTSGVLSSVKPGSASAAWTMCVSVAREKEDFKAKHDDATASIIRQKAEARIRLIKVDFFLKILTRMNPKKYLGSLEVEIPRMPQKVTIRNRTSHDS